MQILLANPLLGGDVQSARHIIELLAAFGLTALIGLERTIQGKSAGLRTQTIVGTSSALIIAASATGSSPSSTPTPTISTTARSG